MLHLDHLLESYVHNDESENLRKLIRYRMSLREKKTVIKNQVHAVLMRNGIKQDLA